MKITKVQNNVKISFYTGFLNSEQKPLRFGQGFKVYFAIALQLTDSKYPFYERRFFNLETKEVASDTDVIKGIQEISSAIYPNLNLDLSSFVDLIEQVTD